MRLNKVVRTFKMEYKCEVCGEGVIKAYDKGIKILCDLDEEGYIGDKHICTKIKRKAKRT